MKIKQVAYSNNQFEWRFEQIHFSNLSLLVGVSGVGKTQILRGIYNLKNIANGASFNGLAWDITFLAENNVEYCWRGEFETKQSLPSVFMEERINNQSKIITEKLFKAEELIVERKEDEIKFRGNKTPRLSPFQSVVHIFYEEEDIAPVKQGFNKIIDSAQSKSVNEISGTYISPNQQYLTLEQIQTANVPPLVKIALVSQYFPGIFKNIKKSFIEVFEQVEDIKIESIIQAEFSLPQFNGFTPASFPIVQIKEKGINKWIVQQNISSGMFKTLMHISELYLCPEGSVILIDEFENSLGVNCIDIITEDLVRENRNLQFIITSHHPYIINNIGLEHWKIVTRKGGVVTVKDAQDLNLGKSKHKAFMQLINSEAYTEGIAA
jgi:predicted ATPase